MKRKHRAGVLVSVSGIRGFENQTLVSGHVSLVCFWTLPLLCRILDSSINTRDLIFVCVWSGPCYGKKLIITPGLASTRENNI